MAAITAARLASDALRKIFPNSGKKKISFLTQFLIFIEYGSIVGIHFMSGCKIVYVRYTQTQQNCEHCCEDLASFWMLWNSTAKLFVHAREKAAGNGSLEMGNVKKARRPRSR